MKANIRQSKADEESTNSGWTSVRKATKAKAFATTNMPGTQSKSAPNTTGVKAFTKQKSKSFEEKMDHGGSGPVSEVVSTIQC